jgi:hypothetical protein
VAGGKFSSPTGRTANTGPINIYQTVNVSHQMYNSAFSNFSFRYMYVVPYTIIIFTSLSLGPVRLLTKGHLALFSSGKIVVELKLFICVFFNEVLLCLSQRVQCRTLR